MVLSGAGRYGASRLIVRESAIDCGVYFGLLISMRQVIHGSHMSWRVFLRVV